MQNRCRDADLVPSKAPTPGARSGTIWLSADRGGEQTVVSVRDTGIGIPAIALSTVFDMFRHVDWSIERTSGGLGIGLALMRGRVEMRGERFPQQASKVKGARSLFTFRFRSPRPWLKRYPPQTRRGVHFDACSWRTTTVRVQSLRHPCFVYLGMK